MKSKLITNQQQVAAAKPGVHRIAGAEGLYLRKNASGSGSWFYRYRAGKDEAGLEKKREMGLGSIVDVTLADARRTAIEHRLQRAGGRDPIEARRRALAERRAQERAEAKKITFAQAAEAYADRNAPTWKHRYAHANWHNPIVKYAYPVIGDLLLDEIGVEHIAEVTDAARKVPDTARTVRQRIERILDDATRRGQRSATIRNPAESKLHRDIGRRRGEREHYRRRELDDAPAAFRKLKELAADSTALSAWVFMIATAVRGGEALNARWTQIDFGKCLWTIPASRMKNNRKHVVPLSSLALAVLKRQATVRAGDAVFPGRGGSPLNYNTFAIAPGQADVDAGTPHSWRSVFRDCCGDRLRVDRDLAEAALSHTLGAVEGAYRRETAIEARRPVMEAYAQWLLGESANVIAFPTRA